MNEFKSPRIIQTVQTKTLSSKLKGSHLIAPCKYNNFIISNNSHIPMSLRVFYHVEQQCRMLFPCKYMKLMNKYV